MVAREKIAELARRKELARAECDLHRAVITIEFQNVADSLRWVDTGARWAHRLGPMLPIAASVAGVLAVSRGTGIFALMRKGLAGFRLAQDLFKRRE